MAQIVKLFCFTCWQGDYGNVSARQQLRKDLKCHDFQWYIDNVYPELDIPPDSLAEGEVRSSEGYIRRVFEDNWKIIFVLSVLNKNMYEPPHDKTNTMACAPSEDSDQPGHPLSLIRPFAVRMKEAWVLSYPLSAQRRLWSYWADAQADLSLRWAHRHFVGFVMRRLIFYGEISKIIP